MAYDSKIFTILQAKAFGYHGYLITKILKIFYIILYAKMIMTLPELLIGFTKLYTTLTFAVYNVKLEKKNYLSRRIICVVIL